MDIDDNPYTLLIDTDKSSDLRLCLSDLLHPTDKSENLLASLSTEQLTVIEHTLTKIKEKKPTTVPMLQPRRKSTQLDKEWKTVASQIAKALVSTMSSGEESDSSAPSSPAKPPHSTVGNKVPETDNEKPQSQEPRTEVRDGVEYVSFVYSHHRVLRRYCIRTDIDAVDIIKLDQAFKSENCVYPRANLPHESYRGNRWAYETECNALGWKLAHLNPDIAGKRGLIQRAVDSYRNRYPSMRSRRVARQEKLMKGVLRKRKNRDDPLAPQDGFLQLSDIDNTRSPKIPKEEKYQPKTISIDDANGLKYRVRINIETVDLDSIDNEFRRRNCLFPRAMVPACDVPTPRRLDEARCNELGWKLAWLNPRQLADKKNLLQRALDIFRTKFVPDLLPRKYASRVPPFSPPVMQVKPMPLTMQALAAQQQQFTIVDKPRADDDNESIYSGTTASLDYLDCFSPPPESPALSAEVPPCGSLDFQSPTFPDLRETLSISSDFLLGSVTSQDDLNCHLSVGSSSSSSPRDEGFPFHDSELGKIMDLETVYEGQSALLYESNPTVFDLCSDDMQLGLLNTKSDDTSFDFFSFNDSFSNPLLNNGAFVQ